MPFDERGTGAVRVTIRNWGLLAWSILLIIASAGSIERLATEPWSEIDLWHFLIIGLVLLFFCFGILVAYRPFLIATEDGLSVYGYLGSKPKHEIHWHEIQRYAEEGGDKSSKGRCKN